MMFSLGTWKILTVTGPGIGILTSSLFTERAIGCVHNNCKRLLQWIKGNFWMEAVNEPTQGGALLDRLLRHREELVKAGDKPVGRI